MLAVVLGLVILVISGAWVVTSRDSGAPPVLSDPAASLPSGPSSSTPDPGPCDDDPTDTGNCDAPPAIETDSLAGAAERLTKGTPDDQDVKYLLIGEPDWEALFASSLGAASRVPGGELVPADGSLIASALAGVTPRFLYQEEWRPDRGGLLVQELVLLEDAAAATAFLGRFTARAKESGLTALSLPAFDAEFSSRLGPGALTTASVNENAVGFFADRRCSVRTAVSAGPVVLVVTFFESGDCSTARVFPSAAAAAALRARVLSLLELRDF
jgi:hypothetical protein